MSNPVTLDGITTNYTYRTQAAGGVVLGEFVTCPCGWVSEGTMMRKIEDEIASRRFHFTHCQKARP